MSSWLARTFTNPVEAQSAFAAHRVEVVNYLRGVLPEPLRQKLATESNPFSAMEDLFLKLNEDNPPLQMRVLEFAKGRSDMHYVLKDASFAALAASLAPGHLAFYPKPGVCCGRANTIDEILAFLTECSATTSFSCRTVLIGGEGGIGKSTVALEVLHNAYIQRIFGEHRYFVACEMATDLASLISGILKALAIVLREGVEPFVALLESLRTKAHILVLDNLERIVKSCAGHEMEIERFLGLLASCCTLVLTFRGLSKTLRIPTGDTLDVTLPKLEDGASRQAFLELGRLNDPYDDTYEDDAFSQLLDLLDGFPLAIALVSRLVRPPMSIFSEVLARYMKYRSTVVQHGSSETRANSLAISIGLSLNSATMQHAREAPQLCHMLAHLPDGGHPDLFAFLDLGGTRGGTSSAANHAQQAAAAVAEAGLALYTPVGLLRMLTPVRDFFLVKKHKELPCALPSAFCSYFFDLTQKAKTGAFKQGNAQNEALFRSRISAEFGNIDAVLMELVGSSEKEKALQAIDAVSDFSHYAHYTNHAAPRSLSSALQALEGSLTTKGGDLLAIKGRLALYNNELDAAENLLEGALMLHRTVKDRLGEANDLQELGRLALRQDNLGKAQEQLERGLSLHRAVGSQLGEAYDLKELGGLALRQSDLEKAQNMFREALKLHRTVGDSLGEANDLEELGRLALHQSDLSKAQDWLEGALKLHRIVGDRLGEANDLQELGELALRQSNLDTAQDWLEGALKLHRIIGDRLGEANDVQGLGGLALRQSDLNKAQEWLEEALKLHRIVRDRLGEANDLKELGRLALVQSDLGKAQEWLERALNLHRAISSRLGEANDLQELGRLALQQGDLDKTQEWLEEALKLHRIIGDRLGEANDLQELGGLALRQSNLSRAKDWLEEALKLHRAVESRLGEAYDLQELGGLALLQNDFDKAQEWFEGALKLHRVVGDRLGEANDLYELGRLAHRQGCPEALKLWTEALNLSTEIDYSWGIQQCRDALDGGKLKSECPELSQRGSRRRGQSVGKRLMQVVKMFKRSKV